MRLFPTFLEILVVFGLICAVLAFIGANRPAKADFSAESRICPSYMVLTCQNRDFREKRPKTAKNRKYRRIPVESLSGRRLGTIEELPTGRIRYYDRRGNIVEDFRYLLPDRYRRD